MKVDESDRELANRELTRVCREFHVQTKEGAWETSWESTF